MNYILVKKSDVGDRFDFAKEIGDGRIVLPCNYLKVLAGKSVEIITEQQAMVLIYGDVALDEEEQLQDTSTTTTSSTKKGK